MFDLMLALHVHSAGAIKENNLDEHNLVSDALATPRGRGVLETGSSPAHYLPPEDTIAPLHTAATRSKALL